MVCGWGPVEKERIRKRERNTHGGTYENNMFFIWGSNCQENRPTKVSIVRFDKSHYSFLPHVCSMVMKT